MPKGPSAAGEKPRSERVKDVPPAVREASDVMEAAHDDRRDLAAQIERTGDDEADKNRSISDEARQRALDTLHHGYPV